MPDIPSGRHGPATTTNPTERSTDGGLVIILTRFHGAPMALNCDLIERVEATPDTVVTMTDGTKYLVTESVEAVVGRVREFRASVVALAHHLEAHPSGARVLRVVPRPEED